MIGAAVTDLDHMRSALALARRGLGQVAPNPAVGCIILRDGQVVGRGWTQPGGRPHAETEALRRAGAAARGATAYVTLEPCSHTGRTPPCADALLDAGIARAVVAIEDPDPRVAGGGIARLRDAGVAVTLGCGAAEAAELNRGFLTRIERGRPLVTLKLATTLDGRLATHLGESQWITGEVARAWGHGLRRGHDAVMVGSNTVLADDPMLTCRLPGLERPAPTRIVVDGRLQTPLTAKLVSSAGAAPTLIVTLAGTDPLRAQAFVDCGVEVLELTADAEGNIDLAATFTALGGRGLTRVLVEGGARLAASLFRGGLVDRIEWFRSPAIMGGDGVPAVQGFGVDHLVDMKRFERTGLRVAGADLLESLRRVG
ncbi:MAG TPA: bifunctional diaminohydroxyphosphoribosylaminopyrimidine deaminase/5-amino-6-(5-phosphoribosylamino)uracil reductase RibD [Stellaceae bacterium]|nr:bifunctional diaminohydroxyphosphoribosylaminopyrimidine deaminase/5-amino-6-(5-phosphoribosylamino)uracil reductase RibD [Stellaceae bacterium]